MKEEYKAYPKHSNKALMSWKKERLVEEINMLLHNWEASCERAENIYQHTKELQAKLSELKQENEETIKFIKYLDYNYSMYLTEDEKFEKWRKNK